VVEKEYAQALLELASEHKILNRVTSELEALSKLLKDNEFKLFLESPSIQVENKKNLLKNTLKDFNEVTNNL
jgi:F0F1-type ATP synthase delta subunit